MAKVVEFVLFIRVFNTPSACGGVIDLKFCELNKLGKGGVYR